MPGLEFGHDRIGGERTGLTVVGVGIYSRSADTILDQSLQFVVIIIRPVAAVEVRAIVVGEAEGDEGFGEVDTASIVKSVGPVISSFRRRRRPEGVAGTSIALVQDRPDVVMAVVTPPVEVGWERFFAQLVDQRTGAGGNDFLARKTGSVFPQ